MKFNFDTTNLKKQVEEQPLIAAGLGAAVLTGLAKFLQAVAVQRNATTYRKETNRRIKNSKR